MAEAVTASGARRERGALLFEQERYDLAEEELRGHLAGDPDDPLGHAILSLTLTELDRLREAEEEARLAIGVGPDEPLSHYALARALVARNAFDRAIAAADEVIRIEPGHPRGYSILAAARLGQRRWLEAVSATDDGLAIEPEHEGLLTMRGVAMQQLGRRTESQAALAGALRQDPSNAYAHASRGLGLLHDGRMSEALEAFLEALRLDPANEMARGGLVEALKARNPLYAALLRGTLWLGRLSGQARVVMLLGFLVVPRVLRGIATSNPGLAPLIVPIIGAYLFVAWMTFAAAPLFNLLLRLDPVGRHALSREQRSESSIVGPLVAVGIPAAIVAIATGSTVPIILAILGLGLVVPVAGAFACDRGWPRTALFGVAAVILLLGVFGIARSLGGDDEAGFAAGVLALVLVSMSSWISVLLSRVRVRR